MSTTTTTTAADNGNQMIGNILSKTPFGQDQQLQQQQQQKITTAEQLATTCQIQFDTIYQCETKYGNNSPVCSSFLTAYKNCLSSELCPHDFKWKSIYCFDQLNNKSTQSDDCIAFSNSLDQCVKLSLQKIWNTPEQH
ncbi:hypothetical protein CYY_007582 [Polysphondylium violaceum]|uniref:Uncharacterized protein n=1 Tax=Polysphondylium violaceum TaxID=133409 RepID=A0A8J4PX14_9MYCE|nr:hypothetical protein CYY_007582 [Polysphondylium violaceum]